MFMEHVELLSIHRQDSLLLFTMYGCVDVFMQVCGRGWEPVS